MKITKESPLLTNYILDEVTEAERLAVEAAAQNDPEIKKAIENLKPAINLAKSLSLKSVNNQLTPEQRQKVLTTIGLGSAKKSSTLSWFGIGGSLVAASLALVVYINNRHQFSYLNDTSQFSAAKTNTSKSNQLAELRAMPSQDLMASDAQNKMARKEMPKAKPSAPNAGLGAAMARSEAEPAKSKEPITEGELGALAGAPSLADAAPAAQESYVAKVEVSQKLSSAARLRADSSRSGGSSFAAKSADVGESFASAKKLVSKIPENMSLEIIAPQELLSNSVAQKSFLTIVENCFANSLSRYSQYNAEWRIDITSQGESSLNISISNIKSSQQNFDANLKCVVASLQNSSKLLLPRTDTVQKWRLILKSK